MKGLILLLFWTANTMMVKAIIDLEQSREDWRQFKLEYKKRYISAAEDLRRLAIYAKNKMEIIQHNKLFQQGKVSYRLQLNEFSDMSNDEFLNTMTGFDYDIDSFEIDDNATINDVAANSRVLNALPDYVDWREKGAVTAVKNQRNCGSCWAFSATGALESQVYLKTKRLIPLSEQNLVDCASGYGCRGCDGGSMNRAYNYIRHNGGIESEETYPYRASQSECRFSSNNISTTVTGYVILRRSEDILKEAVANNGPIAVAIHTMRVFHHYRDGVFYDKDCNGKLTHAVLVVGYGTDATGGDYWLVKNSWGRRWGNNGYIKMARNRDNNCNIVNLASYPRIP